MHAVKTLELGKSDKKIKLKLLDPHPPFPNFPYEELAGRGLL